MYSYLDFGSARGLIVHWRVYALRINIYIYNNVKSATAIFRVDVYYKDISRACCMCIIVSKRVTEYVF